MAEHAIDELVVKLELDANEYKKSDKEIDGIVDKTEKKQVETDRKRKKREVEQNKRTKETTKTVKELGNGMRKLALTVGALLGIGSVGGLVGSVVALANFETSMRRATVSTGLSNREMQAWGGAARRLGADASSGAQALADLAKEQKQFNLTGEGPTLQAFQRMGVNAAPNTPIQDIIGQAQQVYRKATPAQQQQIEAQLSAQGVSNDLIVMIKSETDAREAYNRSLEESTSENAKGLKALSDAMSVTENALLSIANTIATVVQPYIEQFAEQAHQAVTYLSAFADRVRDSGGGLDGFMKVLREQSPELASTVESITTAFRTLGEAVQISAHGLKLIGGGLQALYNWIDSKLGGLLGGNKPGATPEEAHPLKTAVSTVGKAIADAWRTALADSQTHEPAKLTADAQRRLDVAEGRVPAPAAPQTHGGALTPQAFAARAASALGLTPAQALAVAANAQRESGLNPGAVNLAGGGAGARGLFQWRGPRLKAFQAMFGKNPEQASIDEQLDFIRRDPEEQRSLKLALKRGGNSAMTLAESFSRNFERHGNVAEDVKRGQLAAQLEAQGAAPAAGASGPAITITGPVTVQADNPRELTNGLQRASGTQNYQSAVR